MTSSRAFAFALVFGACVCCAAAWAGEPGEESGAVTNAEPVGPVLRGARVAGVEPDPKAAASLREEGFEVFNGSLQDFAQKAAGEFDVVTISHVVEHINQPIGFLARDQRLPPVAAPGLGLPRRT